MGMRIGYGGAFALVGTTIMLAALTGYLTAWLVGVAVPTVVLLLSISYHSKRDPDDPHY